MLYSLNDKVMRAYDLDEDESPLVLSILYLFTVPVDVLKNKAVKFKHIKVQSSRLVRNSVAI